MQVLNHPGHGDLKYLILLLFQIQKDVLPLLLFWQLMGNPRSLIPSGVVTLEGSAESQ